jgi:hypothetical protein
MEPSLGERRIVGGGWVQSFPRALRFRFDTWPAIKGKLFGIV